MAAVIPVGLTSVFQPFNTVNKSLKNRIQNFCAKWFEAKTT